MVGANTVQQGTSTLEVFLTQPKDQGVTRLRGQLPVGWPRTGPVLRFDKWGSAGTVWSCNIGFALADSAQTASQSRGTHRFPRVSLHAQKRDIAYLSHLSSRGTLSIRSVYHVHIAYQLRVYCSLVNFSTAVKALKSHRGPLQSVAYTPHRFNLISSPTRLTELFPDFRHMRVHGTPLHVAVLTPHRL